MQETRKGIVSPLSAERRVAAQEPRRRRRLSNAQFAWLIISPSLIILALVVIYPLVRSIIMSFQQYNLSEPATLNHWVGLRHYRLILTNGDFLESLRITAVFVVGAVGGQFILGFIFALILNQDMRARGLFRGLLLMPWVIPTVVGAMLWTWIFNVQYGILNFVLRDVGVIHSFHGWLTDPKLALGSVIFATVWKWFPFHLVMLLAGLQTVPQDLLDAAAVDGCGAGRRFFHVTLPHLRNIVWVILLLSTIWSFQEFTMIWGTTRGTPMNVTATLPVLVYKSAFQYYRVGQAAAIGTLWLIIVLALSGLVARFGFRREAVN